jgi:alkanesulfonate monooxygenase SsuD/methylene tetrahydromethanopterin reductase-like flavin-dependent oxidoreductase (luciferase family)
MRGTHEPDSTPALIIEWTAPAALAMAIPYSGELRLCTRIALPAIRGPLSLAETLISIDGLSGGRLIAGLA